LIDQSPASHASIQRSALWITTLAAFLTPFGLSSVNIALPSMGKEFSMDAVLLGWVTTAYLLGAVMLLVPVGKIADTYGRKRMFTLGITTFTLGSAGCAVSNSPWMLILFRSMQGVGAASIYPVGAAILTSVFRPGELGRVLGINTASVYLGYSFGPLLGGYLTHQMGWRSIFLVNLIVGATILFLIFWTLPAEWRVEREERFDRTGSLLYSAILLAILYGFSQLPKSLAGWLLASGLAAAVLFVRREMHIKNPVLEVDLFRANRLFAMSSLAAFVSSSATFLVTFLLSLYLQYIKGLTPGNAGLVLVCQAVVQAVVSPFSGRVSDRIEPRYVASIGMAATLVGLLLLSMLDERTSLGFILGSLILVGVGSSFFSVSNASAAMGSVEKRLYGAASGTLSTMRMTGMAFSMGTAVLIFSIYMGKVQITPVYHAVFLKCIKLAFALFAIFCFGGVFASLTRGNVMKTEVDQPRIGPQNL
jgi:EmrB/QacA subfamily drug resistance transporter